MENMNTKRVFGIFLLLIIQNILWAADYSAISKIAIEIKQNRSRNYEFPIGVIDYVSKPRAQEYPAIAFDGVNYLVVWEDSNDIYGARVSPDGDVIDHLGFAISNTHNNPGIPAVAFDGTNYMVVWWRNPGGPSQVYGARVSPGGIVLDPDGILISVGAGPYVTSVDPAITFNGKDFLVAWSVWENNSNDIYGSRVNTAGVVLDTNWIAISTAVDWQLYPEVAAGNDNCLVIWIDQRVSGNWYLYGSRVDTSGAVLDPEGIPIYTVAGIGSWSSVAYDGANYMTAWSSGDDIYAGRVDSAGNVLDPNGIAVAVANNWQWQPAITFNGTNYFISWTDERNLSLSHDIYGARVTTSGTMLDPNGFIISSNINYQWYPAVASDSSSYFVVWEDGRGPDYDIFGSRIDPNGQVLDPNGIVIASTTNDQNVAAVAFDGVNYLAVWSEWRGITRNDIIGVRIAQDGTIIDTVPIFITRSAWDQSAPSIAYGGDCYLVAWQEYRTGWQWEIRGSRVTSGGVVLDTAGIAIGSAYWDQQSPAVSYGGNDYAVVWQDNRINNNGHYYDIYGTIVTQAGQVLFPNGIIISNAYLHQMEPAIAFDGTNFLAVWSDGRLTTAYDLFGARISTTGTVLDPGGIIIDTATNDQATPAIAFDGTNYVAIWADNRYGWRNIHGSRITPGGMVLDTVSVLITGASNWQINPALAFDNADYCAVWQDNRDGNGFRLYGTFIDTSMNMADSIIVSLQAGFQSFPALVRGPGNQLLAVYTNELDTIAGNSLIWGCFLCRCLSRPELISPVDDQIITDSLVTFVWHPAVDTAHGIDHYTVKIGLDVQLINSDSYQSADTSIALVLTDTTYYWQVIAVCNDSAKSTSAIRRFSIDAHAPDTPLLLYPINGILVGQDPDVHLCWSAVSFIDFMPVRYILEIDTLSDFGFPLYTDTLSNNDAHASLYERMCFYWRVMAYDLAGHVGDWSDPDSFGVDLTVPLIESTTVWIDTIFAGPFPVDCRVTDNTAVDSVFLFYLRCEDTTWQHLAMAEAGSWFLGEIPEVSLVVDTVRYYIKAYDIAEPSNFSTDPPSAPLNTYQFAVDRTPFVNETDADLRNEFMVSVSSPACNVAIFNIIMRANTEVKLTIYDVTGRCAARFRVKNDNYLTRSVKYKASAGVYFYMLDCGGQRLKGKVILLR